MYSTRKTITLVLGGLLLGTGLAHAHLPEAPQVRAPIESWHTYRSSTYDFAVALPTNWIAEEPRADGGVGQVVTLRAPMSAAKIEIGIHSAGLIDGLSFAEWQSLYTEATAVLPLDEVQEQWHSIPQAADGRALRYRTIHSAAVDTMFLMQIPHGETVWFVAGYMHPKDAWIFREMAASFTFGSASPQTVAEAYGADFPGLDLHEVLRIRSENEAAAMDGEVTAQGLYRMPFEALTGSSGIVRGPNCGSTHQGASSQAIDYMLYTGKPVLASYSGWIGTLAYSEQGFGRYMIISHGSGYTTLYAHLDSYAGNPWSGMGVSTGCVIAYAGCTGNCDGSHLHFEKRYNGQSQDITSLPTTVWYTPGVTCGNNQAVGYAQGPDSPCAP